MRKLFTPLDKIEVGIDVKANEEYLQLGVLNIWTQPYAIYTIHRDKTTYIVYIASKVDNTSSYSHRRARREELTKQEIKEILKIVNNE